MLLYEQHKPEIQPIPVIRKTYGQDWANYNLAQVNEKTRFLELLYELCTQVEDIPRQKGAGRNRIPLSDMVFAIVYKTYSTVSGRRFMSDLAESVAKGYISRFPHFNSLYNYFELDEMKDVLQYLIRESARALKTIEMDFAVDSSGFSLSSGKISWVTAKYTNGFEVKDWLKCHLICGVKTNIVANVEITNSTSHDHNYFKPLVERTAEDFEISQVSADKAYLSAKNFKAVADVGGMAYIPFKSNSSASPKRETIWRNMYHYFMMHRTQYMNFYHKRSNVETCFSMIKAKFGEKLRSKTEKAQINELLCKVLCHNICCVIQSIYELGIETDFYRE
ncbi:MAG TPA: transposase [Pyrinomonadaceae bacterium]|nr:transposase [Pyrinomonadaceae bacterium]